MENSMGQKMGKYGTENESKTASLRDVQKDIDERMLPENGQQVKALSHNGLCHGLRRWWGARLSRRGSRVLLLGRARRAPLPFLQQAHHVLVAKVGGNVGRALAVLVDCFRRKACLQEQAHALLAASSGGVVQVAAPTASTCVEPFVGWRTNLRMLGGASGDQHR